MDFSHLSFSLPQHYFSLPISVSALFVLRTTLLVLVAFAFLIHSFRIVSDDFGDKLSFESPAMIVGSVP